MSKHLIFFTIGPVQSFISQARKTQDLYAGSALLSHIVEEALKGREKEIIFPSLSVSSKPNRFILEMETDKPEEKCKAIKEVIERAFQKRVDSALNNAGFSECSQDGLEKQIGSFLEIHYGAIPCNGDYSEDYAKLERLLGSVKNGRVFSPLSELGRKCSLCGERNVLFCSEDADFSWKCKDQETLDHLTASYLDEFNSNLRPLPKTSSITLSAREGLCGICLVKRFYKGTTFPSTAKIALGDTLQKLENHENAKENLKSFEDLFRASDFDEQLFYKENLSSHYFEKAGIPSTILKEAQKLQKALSEKAKEKGLSWSPYYALIMLDGDSMGAWLSGEYLKDKSRLKDYHKSISTSLGDYSKSVKDAISFPKGRPVYIGGDDVLVFVNLEYLKEVMTALRENFPAFQKLGETTNHQKSTASAGVVIAHYKTPLSEVLSQVRTLEKKAKKLEGKDSFALGCMKHSGEMAETLWKWNWENRKILETFENLRQWLSKNTVSNTFIFTLKREFARILSERKGEDQGNLDPLVKVELERLLKRSYQEKDGKDRLKDFTKDLWDLYSGSASFFSNHPGKINPLSNFISLLEIAEFLSRYSHKG